MNWYNWHDSFNILSDCSLCPRLVPKLPSIRRKTKPLMLPFVCRPSSRLQFVPTLWALFTTKWPKTIVSHMLSTVMLVSWKIIALLRVVEKNFLKAVIYLKYGSHMAYWLIAIKRQIRILQLVLLLHSVENSKCLEHWNSTKKKPKITKFLHRRTPFLFASFTFISKVVLRKEHKSDNWLGCKNYNASNRQKYRFDWSCVTISAQ